MVNPRAWLAEAIATFGLVFFGPLSVILSAAWYGDGLSTEAIIFISLGHGGIIVLMVYAFGHISGAHINPAVTIPMMITKKIDVKDGIGYIVFQVIGGIIASLSLIALFPEIGKGVLWGGHGGPSELLNFDMGSAFIVEIVLTFFLVVVIFINVASIISRIIFSNPLVGDFELVKIGSAVAIASFFPLCHLRKGNVIVDFITANLNAKKIFFLDALSSLVYTIIACFFTWRMIYGAKDMFKYSEETMLLQFPVWIPFIPVIFSFGLLSFCCLYTFFKEYNNFSTKV